MAFSVLEVSHRFVIVMLTKIMSIQFFIKFVLNVGFYIVDCQPWFIGEVIHIFTVPESDNWVQD